MDRPTFLRIVEAARMAPSTHNTQPVRWQMQPGGLTLWADLRRRLPIGDPDDRDLFISCGAAAEATVLAMAQEGMGAAVSRIVRSAEAEFLAVAEIHEADAPRASDKALFPALRRRATHRVGFTPAALELLDPLKDGHVTLVTDRSEIRWLARRIDRASAHIMRDDRFRRELLEWMRVRPGQRHAQDGLTMEALGLSKPVALLSAPILRGRLYSVLSNSGLGPTLSGEAGRSKNASAVALIHWPETDDPFDAGRAFMRTWLVATEQGLVAWPAAALADDPETEGLVRRRYGVPSERRLINALRLGGAKGVTPKQNRLSVDDVIKTP